MAVCPTNTLQPAALDTDFNGLLAPLMTPAIGPCEPACTACGQACPFDAVVLRKVPDLPLPVSFVRPLKNFQSSPFDAKLQKAFEIF